MGKVGLQSAASIKGAASVGRQPEARHKSIKWTKGSMRWRFVTSLRRLTEGKSQDEVAALLKCSADQASKWLSGDRIPDMEKWETIAKRLGCDWSEFFKK